MTLFVIVACGLFVLTHFLVESLDWHGAASTTTFLLVAGGLFAVAFRYGTPDFQARLGVAVAGVILFLLLGMAASFLGMGGGCDSVGHGGCISDL
jgi:hypothetical protein